MNNPFNDIVKTLKSLDKQVNPFMREIIKEFSPEIEDLNAEQLKKGERSDNASLPDYSPTSVSVYGKPPGPIRLYDQGDFWDGIRTKIEEDGFTLVGTDTKTPKLKRDYGEEIIGLQKSSIEYLENMYIEDEMESKYKTYLDENIKP